MSETTPPVVAENAGEQLEDTKKESHLDKMSQEVQDFVNDIKSKGVSVYITFLGDNAYVFRPLKVMEFTRLQDGQKQRAQAEGATEEFLQASWLEAITLAGNLAVVTLDDLGEEHLQAPISRENIKAQYAGVPSTLAQEILRWSGFDDNPMTVKL